MNNGIEIWSRRIFARFGCRYIWDGPTPAGCWFMSRIATGIAAFTVIGSCSGWLISMLPWRVMRTVIAEWVYKWRWLNYCFHISYVYMVVNLWLLRESFWWPFALIISIPCLICVLIIFSLANSGARHCLLDQEDDKQEQIISWDKPYIICLS